LLTLASSFSFSQFLWCALCSAFRILNLSVIVDCTLFCPKFLIRFFFNFYLCSQHVSVITLLHISKFIWQFKVTFVYITIYLGFVYVCLSISLALLYGLHDICWDWMFVLIMSVRVWASATCAFWSSIRWIRAIWIQTICREVISYNYENK
jgi:hypothetical protein